MSAGAIGANTTSVEDLYTSSTQEKAAAEEKTKNKSEVSSEAFMQLLVTQMTNQDPLEPMSNEQMMSQLAQLQTLEEQRDMTASVVEMSESMKTMQADNTKLLTSLLESVNTNDQAIFTSLEAARLEGQISTASSLIGKDITGTVIDGNGNEVDFSGVAQSVSINNGIAFLNFPSGEHMAVVDVKTVE